jgi:uncharacterized repeat protein (TIGR03803 family)
MPWTSDDAERHTRKASTRALKELWAKVANESLERDGDEGRAIRSGREDSGGFAFELIPLGEGNALARPKCAGTRSAHGIFGGSWWVFIRRIISMRLSSAVANRASLVAVAALLGGCSSSSPGVPPALPSASAGVTFPTTASRDMRQGAPEHATISVLLRPSVKEKVLHTFGAGSDGVYPESTLIAVNGTFYGTTLQGGAHNLGSVFKIGKSGTESVLHSFAGGSDGAYPKEGLTDVNGTLYGTTDSGGGTGCTSGSGCGTVFSITTSGKEHVLYRFKGGTDGESPVASLTDVHGTLYGTTVGGGGVGCGSAGGCGTVFKITTSGKERVLYSFKGGTDGAQPYAGLTDVNGTLYGATFAGGANGAGTIIKITTSGVETVLYSFQGGSADGESPYASLTDVNGTLYGTTQYGGANLDGTAFKVTTSGTEKVLHSFLGGANDGAFPLGVLAYMNGALYGTTYYGGSSGDGVIFKMTTSGRDSVLYGFKGGSDGAYPYAGLTKVNLMFYGTTELGGSHARGTVFSLAL